MRHTIFSMRNIEGANNTNTARDGSDKGLEKCMDVFEKPSVESKHGDKLEKRRQDTGGLRQLGDSQTNLRANLDRQVSARKVDIHNNLDTGKTQ